jgi:glycosyltransferase involved in cell wall biosynthesis
VIAKLTGSRCVFEKHSDPASHREGLVKNVVLWGYRQVEAFTIRRSDAVIGTGLGLVDLIRQIAPASIVHHIFDIPSSLAEADEDKVNVIRSVLQRAPADIVITYVGSFAVYQGIDLMFESMPIVLREHENARFVIIGGSDEEIAERKAWLSLQGIDDAVKFVGKIPPDELPNYLVASDVLLSPRIAGNNTPLKLLDYLKAGRAIVATDNQSNRLILDDSNAMLVEPTPEAYAEGIAHLVEEESSRSRLAAKGHSLIATIYNFEQFKDRLKKCYEELLAR